MTSSRSDKPSIAASQVARRAFLRDSGLGFGALALGAMLHRDGYASSPTPLNLGLPTHAPKAKRVIWLFMRGGVSQMESFDPKPELTRYAGKTITETPYAYVESPEKLKNVRVVVVNDANGKHWKKIYPLQVGFKKYGQAGIEISDWFPHIGGMVDDISIIRSMWTTDNNHGAQVQFHSGRHMLDPRVPTIGSWVNYGLGSMNANLPEFISMGPRFFDTRDAHYLGPKYESVKLKIDPQNPLDYAAPEGDLPTSEQQHMSRLTRRLNLLNKNRFPDDPKLEARIQAYELGFRMQTAVPEAIQFAQESNETQSLYGLDHDVTRPFGEQLLAARRFAERGVRFIQIMHGDGAAGAWDQHSNLKKRHGELAAQVDRPIAGLLKDLKQRGLLDETLIVFGTEFGRTPGAQNADGRDHHPFGFSVWMAGGGIQGGLAHGATDELGFHAIENPHYVTDVHATLLHQLGLDPKALEIAGHKRLERDFGNVIKDILV